MPSNYYEIFPKLLGSDTIYVTFNPQLKARITSHKAQFSGTPNLTVT